MFVLRSGLRFWFRALEVPKLRVRKRSVRPFPHSLYKNQKIYHGQFFSLKHVQDPCEALLMLTACAQKAWKGVKPTCPGNSLHLPDDSPPPIRVLGLSAQDRAIKLRESSQELQPPYETGVTLQHPQGTHLRPLELPAVINSQHLESCCSRNEFLAPAIVSSVVKQVPRALARLKDGSH